MKHDNHEITYIIPYGSMATVSEGTANPLVIIPQSHFLSEGTAGSIGIINPTINPAILDLLSQLSELKTTEGDPTAQQRKRLDGLSPGARQLPDKHGGFPGMYGSFMIAKLGAT